nr:hypothetical protein CFP56_12914 [Quercus suber]
MSIVTRQSSDLFPGDIKMDRSNDLTIAIIANRSDVGSIVRATFMVRFPVTNYQAKQHLFPARWTYRVQISAVPDGITSSFVDTALSRGASIASAADSRRFQLLVLVAADKTTDFPQAATVPGTFLASIWLYDMIRSGITKLDKHSNW